MSRTEFFVLGSVRVRQEGRELPLTGRRARALLAYLLLHPNRLVARDRLLAALWSSPPPTAPKIVQITVSQLRKALGDGLLMTEPGGYRLAVLPEQVDVERFARLVEQGRAELAAGKAAQAIAVLEEALGLWRGDPLADLADAPFAGPERERLEEIRLAALEERFEADLALGRGGSLVPDLERHVAENPLRERFCAQLMLALYRAGRQAEALELYRETRDLLVQEVGVEPGQELRRLHRAVLTQDPALDRRAIDGGLPVRAGVLIGREREVDAIVAELERGGLVSLVGPGGVGKTRLALAAAQRATGRFEDGVAFVPLDTVSDPDLVVPAVARALGAERETAIPDLARKNALLVLDSFEHLLPAATDVARLAAQASRTTLLVTSREALRVGAESVYRVEPLPVPSKATDEDDVAENPAVRLFISRAQAVGRDCRNALDAVAELCRRLDGLPLAIELVAARTRMLPPQAMLDRVEGRLDLAGTGARDAPPRQRTLRATLDWSFALLEPSEQLFFGRLAVFPGDFPLDAAGALEDRWILDELERLVDRSLVARTSSDEPRFRLLDTVREYALEKLDTEEARKARQRHGAWYRDLAERADRQLSGPDQRAWLDLLEREHANLRAALDFFVASEDGESALRLASALRRYLDLRGYAVEGRAWLEAAVAAGSNADARLRVKALGGAGVLAAQQGDLAAARSLFEQSVALARTTDDDERLASELANLAHAAVLQGDRAPARAAYEEAAELQQRTGSTRNLAITLENLGCLALLQDDVRGAIAFLEEAHVVGRSTGDSQVLAATLISLSRGLLVSGSSAKARPRLRESLELLTEVGWVEGTAECLELLALADARAKADRAVLLLGAADQLRARIGTERHELEQRSYDTAAGRAREQLGAAAYKAGMTRGAAMPLPDVLALCNA
jgi:predicted ATPase/DNA-binding SARP family transcriptional activator